MRGDFPVDTGNQLPELPCSGTFGGEAFRKLPDDGLDTAAYRDDAGDEGFWARVRHVPAQGGMESHAHRGQILGQEGTDEPLVAKQRTANVLQWQVKEGVTFIERDARWPRTPPASWPSAGAERL